MRRIFLRSRTADIVAGGVVVLLLLAVAVILPPEAPDRLAGRGSAIDGDSLRLSGHELRLRGIDAPEFRQDCDLDGQVWACGKAARDALAGLLGRGDIECDGHGHDRFGRVLATCRAGATEINEWLVENGWAVDFGGYAMAEARAHKARRGIWRARFERPADWRAADR